MKLTIGELSVILDALHGRLKFGDAIVDGPWFFTREQCHRVLEKIYNDPDLLLDVKIEGRSE